MTSKARQAELGDQVSHEDPDFRPQDLKALRRNVTRALKPSGMPERKAVMQALVAEIRVEDPSRITPVFRIPIFREPHGSVPPGRTERKARTEGGMPVQLTARYSLA